MNRAARILVPTAILALATVAAFAIFASRPVPETRRPEVPPPLVRVIATAVTTEPLSVHSQGTVEPRTEIRIVPEVSGRVVRVADTLVAGGFFERGDVLLEIDPFDYRQEVVRARAQVAQASLRLAREEAEADVARREWSELGRGDGSPLALREPQVADARAALEAAEAALEQARRDLERTVLRAPFGGRVRSEDIDVGQFVNRGTPVATVYAVDWAEVRLPLPDRELAFVDAPLDHRGDAVEDSGPEVVLRAEFAGRTHAWTGRIVRTEGEIDARTRMVHVVARVRDPYGRGRDASRPPLSVGMFVHAEIRGRRAENVVALPRAALRGENRVWVIDGDDRLRFREVRVLRSERDRVLIDAGLEAGERVCVSPMEAVTDGMRVRVAGGGGEPEPTPAGDAGAGESRA